MNNNPIIHAANINLTLGTPVNKVEVLKDISFNVMPGERISVIGPSGSGKTSLIMVLAGLEPPTSGSVRINQIDFSSLNEDGLARFRRHHLGIVFQNFHLISTMSALENVALPLELARGELTKGETDQTATQQNNHTALEIAALMLEQLGLGHRLHHFPSQLSGGEQQRVALARAFIAKPSVILADEPTGNLDEETGKKIIEFLFELCEENQTCLLLITHDRSLAQRCDRQLVLNDGCLMP